ncbi:helix-turn-helix domain-containing protein [Streptomyces sp. NPDC088847]|uniref:helix-turn-helix domain-containing protein n=1 Tax=Streptomyces sp. NPDC088847 TaxID=3365909 RepID=UPI0038149596
MPRTENELPPEVPLSLRSLALDMRTLRKDSHLTITELAKVSGYSTAALSGATAGKTVPSWDLVQAFVMGCGYDGDMERWARAHRAARRDVKGPSSSEDTGEHQMPRLTNLVPLVLRRGSEPVVPSASSMPAQPDGLLALVQQARKYERRDKRVSSVTSADYVHTALALCTTPEDIVELMNELVTDKALSVQELEERSRKHFPIGISDATFTQVLSGSQLPALPTTEWLYIFLSACGLEEERTVMWHFTVTRIRIAQMRQAEREAFNKSRRRRRELREMITAIREKTPYFYLAAATWAMLVIPILSKKIQVPW